MMVGSGGHLVLMELNHPFLPGSLSEDLVSIDAKELTCSTGLGRSLCSLDLKSPVRKEIESYLY